MLQLCCFVKRTATALHTLLCPTHCYYKAEAHAHLLGLPSPPAPAAAVPPGPAAGVTNPPQTRHSSNPSQLADLQGQGQARRLLQCDLASMHDAETRRRLTLATLIAMSLGSASAGTAHSCSRSVSRSSCTRTAQTHTHTHALHVITNRLLCHQAGHNGQVPPRMHTLQSPRVVGKAHMEWAALSPWNTSKPRHTPPAASHPGHTAHGTPHWGLRVELGAYQVGSLHHGAETPVLCKKCMLNCTVLHTECCCTTYIHAHTM